ncbi:FliM/FliN family flagellar motor switch protein [Halodesulfovibrio marinisediminis]|uniref:Type III secretion system apparatus protein YscQ/HrcQ n=1 Tax=Halodesulfovibrio marinisediminis DSM 17456 TaxID=1121457 RepID=A0A1N6I8Y8_9BACT|nr:FliM/FliN family flagellar motor switch protein [Halodesulfovibrio marinisediminis]SIO28425.1 type III secretion system apparatus protein YscQ/HrcQ [Halodesulfovibrio marinisediminis DSM 17456]
MSKLVVHETIDGEFSLVPMPKCSRAHAQLTQRIAQNVIFPLPALHGFAGLEGVIRCSDLGKRADTRLVMILLIGSERVWVEWQSIALLVEQIGATHGATFFDLPEQLQRVAVARCVEPLLQELGGRIEQPVVLESIQFDGSDQEQPGASFLHFTDENEQEICSFILNINGGGKRCLAACHVAFNADGVFHKTLLDILPQPIENDSACHDFLIEVSCVAGSQLLTRAEIASLCCGDVLLSLSSEAENQGTMYGLMVGTTPIGVARPCEHGVEVVSLVPHCQNFIDRSGGIRMEEAVELVDEIQEHTEETLGESIDTSALELEVVFEVARSQFTLQELRQVSKGYIFTTDVSADAPITIKAGNKEIGKGRLVSVADRIGIEILATVS